MIKKAVPSKKSKKAAKKAVKFTREIRFAEQLIERGMPETAYKIFKRHGLESSATSAKNKAVKKAQSRIKKRNFLGAADIYDLIGEIKLADRLRQIGTHYQEAHLALASNNPQTAMRAAKTLRDLGRLALAKEIYEDLLFAHSEPLDRQYIQRQLNFIDTEQKALLAKAKKPK